MRFAHTLPMLIPASLSHTQQADASHIWPQYLRDLSVAPELRLTMSAVLGGPHSLNSCLKWLHVRFESVCFFRLVWNCKAQLKVPWSGLPHRGKRHIVLFTVFDGGTRPSCPPVARRKWDHEFDGRRGQREMSFGLLSFLPSVPFVF